MIHPPVVAGAGALTRPMPRGRSANQDPARYERDHPLVIELADALQFEPHELDALWAAAAEL